MITNMTKPMMLAVVLGSTAGTAIAGQDWQAQRLQEAAQVAAEHEYRWQQQTRLQESLRTAQSDDEADARHQQQYRWQQREQQRQRLSVSASNVAGRTTMSNKGPR